MVTVTPATKRTRVAMEELSDSELTGQLKRRVAQEHEATAEVLALLAEVAFRSLELNRLHTETYDIRPSHISVLEASGFQQEGRMREHVVIAGKPTDALLHGRLRSDWATGG